MLRCTVLCGNANMLTPDVIRPSFVSAASVSLPPFFFLSFFYYFLFCLVYFFAYRECAWVLLIHMIKNKKKEREREREGEIGLSQCTIGSPMNANKGHHFGIILTQPEP
jgi:hypothetical protein